MSQAKSLRIDFMSVDKDDKRHHHNDRAIGDHWWDHKHCRLLVSPQVSQDNFLTPMPLQGPITKKHVKRALHVLDFMVATGELYDHCSMLIM
jgi:hypothetical protein